jgi:putative hemolysin
LRIGTEVLIIFLLILANGVFAMSEIAVVAARKVRLQQRADEGDERAKRALELAHDPNRFLSTVQFGITLVGVLAGAYGGATIAAQLAVPISEVPQLARYAEGIALGLVVTGITVMSLIFGELVPKRIGLNNPEVIASWVARPMILLSKIGGPVIHGLTAATNLVLRVFGVKGEAEPNLTEDEIKALISQGAETGAVGATEENIVQRVFQLGDQRVAAIMTPRPDIEWIDVDATEEELREFLASHAHTQFVVCHGGLDEVLGIVRSADLLPLAFKGVRIDLRSLTKEALFVPDSMPAVQLLESFRGSHKHVALVMDEYGAVEGLVTVTDLLTAIVGELPADASEAAGAFVSRADGSWLVDGSAPMEDVTTHFLMDGLPEDEAGAYHTIGGFVMARLGRVPKTADAFEWGGLKFEVMDMDGRRIDKVLVMRSQPPQPAR